MQINHGAKAKLSNEIIGNHRAKQMIYNSTAEKKRIEKKEAEKI